MVSFIRHTFWSLCSPGTFINKPAQNRRIRQKAMAFYEWGVNKLHMCRTFIVWPNVLFRRCLPHIQIRSPSPINTAMLPLWEAICTKSNDIRRFIEYDWHIFFWYVTTILSYATIGSLPTCPVFVGSKGFASFEGVSEAASIGEGA